MPGAAEAVAMEVSVAKPVKTVAMSAKVELGAVNAAAGGSYYRQKYIQSEKQARERQKNKRFNMIIYH